MKPECVMSEIEIPDPMCPVTIWSDWSPCSVTCGSGVKIRTRVPLVDESLKEECGKRLVLNEQEPCTNRPDCLFDDEAALGM